jgi:hypothetical protein
MRIQWTENALQELEALLGARVDIDPEEIDDALGGLDFPWPITIKSVTADKDPSGETWANLIIEFDEIVGASGYEVRMNLLDPDGQIELKEPTIVKRGSISQPGNATTAEGNAYDRSFVVDFEPRDDDLVIIVGPGNMIHSVSDLTDGPTGGYDTWTAIHNPNNGSLLGVWRGSGAGSGDILYANAGPLTEHGFAVLLVVREWGGATLLDYDVNLENNAASVTTASLTAQRNQLIITGVKTNGGLISGQWWPDGTWTDTGFTGTYIKNHNTGNYANGAAASVGMCWNNNTTVNTQYGFDGGFGSRTGETITMRFGL